MGYAIMAKRVVEPQAVDPDQTDDPARMSWKKYVAWREAQEEKRRGRKKGFVLPKPIQRT